MENLQNVNQIGVREITFPTIGKVKVFVQGNLSERKSIFLTIHDIGTSHESFYDFINHDSMTEVKEHSVFLHVCLPGHDEFAATLINYQFPNLDTIAKELVAILNDFNLTCVFVIGEGAGANIACRFALVYPNKCLGLALINCTAAQAGWIEYAKEKWIQISDGQGLITQSACDFLIGHRFGGKCDPNSAYVQAYLASLRRLNASNIGLYVDAYMQRSSIIHELPNFKQDTLLVGGSNMDDVAAVENMHSCMNKQTTDILILHNIGNVIAEAPGDLAKAFILFGKQCGLLGSVTLPGLTSLKDSQNSDK